MPRELPTTHRSISLPAATIRRLEALARSRNASVSQTAARIVETGLDAELKQRQQYLGLIDELATSGDSQRRKQIKKELARLTFED